MELVDVGLFAARWSALGFFGALAMPIEWTERIVMQGERAKWLFVFLTGPLMWMMFAGFYVLYFGDDDDEI